MNVRENEITEKQTEHNWELETTCPATKEQRTNHPAMKHP